jgi:hypothetical protein
MLQVMDMYWRMRQLSRQMQAQSHSVAHADSVQFALFPTCPASTSIVFAGGLGWYSANALWPSGYYLPTYEVDLTDPAKVSVRRSYSGYTYTFTNAHWYAPAIVIISNYIWPGPAPPDTWPEEPPDDMLYLYGQGTSPYLAEFETAAEAEEACTEIIGENAAPYGVAAGGVILRNNGDVTNANQYMPVDFANWGRSYLFGGKRYGWKLI